MKKDHFTHFPNFRFKTLVALEPSVCTKTPNSLARAEVNHAPGSYVYTTGGFCTNSKMADSTTGQLELALRVNKASAKAFEPTSRTYCILGKL